MEIKYRAWDKGRKEYLSAGNVFIEINPKSRPKESNIYLDLIDHPDMYKDRFIIEPFTGLKDINGNEIYKGDRLRGHGNNDDIVVVEFGEFYVINVETLEKIDKVIGWHTDVLKTDGISMCEPFCLSMPLTEEYIQICGYEVLRKTIHEVEMGKVIK